MNQPSVITNSLLANYSTESTSPFTCATSLPSELPHTKQHPGMRHVTLHGSGSVIIRGECPKSARGTLTVPSLLVFEVSCGLRHSGTMGTDNDKKVFSFLFLFIVQRAISSAAQGKHQQTILTREGIACKRTNYKNPPL